MMVASCCVNIFENRQALAGIFVATITIVSGANAGRTYELGDREMVIGRDALCEIVVPVRTISRRHARVGKDQGGYYVEDLGSVNGTYINGQRLEGRGRLAHQDRIRISQNVFQFFDSSHEQTIMLDAAMLRGEAPAAEAAPAEDESRLVRIVSSLEAGAAAAEVNPEAKLRAVLEITRSLGSSLQLDDVLPRILDSLFRIFPQADHGYVLQAPRLGAPLEPIAIKHRNSDSDTISPIGGPIVARVMTEGVAFLSSPQEGDSESVLGDGPASVMCAPLMGPSQTPLGVIHLDTFDHARPFDQGDLDVLVAVATVAGQAVEYTRMHADLLELDRQKRDLATAQDVQLHFLPQRPPDVKGYKFYDYYRAAATVAGDYYDYIALPDGRLAITIGDVSGKGMPAALLMARLCSDVRYSLLTTPTPAEVVNMLNRQLVAHLRTGRFVTFVLLVLDPLRHTISIVNAGHAPPLWRDAGSKEVRPIAAGEKAEIPLGIRDDVKYSQIDLPMQRGDLILTYTDGVNDAAGPEGETYGNQRVRAALAAAPADVVHVGQAVVADVRRFSSGHRQSDDICLVCFGRSD
jgi:serine phosphatase RsbU (regulator of sigma subunit)/pSer/pThr/pTyr-binding forkhead associated (FHA) protein